MTEETRAVTLITGASAGIGAALAHEFAVHGHEVVLIARREQALAAVADAIAAKGAPRPTMLPADVARPDAARAIAQALAQRGLEPDVVINNAGFGLVGSADKLDRAEQLAMIDLNVRTLTALSLMFVDSLKRRGGGVINVASLSGFFPGPGMAVYFAGKAYVRSFSEAIAHELARQAVRVTCVCPGPVPTEFQARAGLRDQSWQLLARSAEQIAREGYDAFMRGQRVVVPGALNKIAGVLPRFMPRALALRAVGRFLKRAGPPITWSS